MTKGRDRQAALEAMGLKHLPRAGWARVGVRSCDTHADAYDVSVESVAAHSWGVAMLTLLRCPPELDRHRVLAMAILHDLAEVRVGDLTPHDGVPADVKHAREREAIHAMLGHRPELLALWEEAEAGVTAEARFLKLLDRADMGLQAERYKMRHHDVSEFLDSTRDARAALFDSGPVPEVARPALGDEPSGHG